MKRILIISAILFGGIVIAQQKKNALNNWKSRDGEIAQKVFTKYQEKENKKLEDKKADLIKTQRKLKIEIVNAGDFEKYNQNMWLGIVKVNNGNLEQIVCKSNTEISVVTNTMGTNNWKDEAGGLNYKSFNELMKISQEFTNYRNEAGISENSLKPIEFIETSEPVLYFSLKIYTHKGGSEQTTSSTLSKTINIYADNQLIKTLKYSLDDLIKAEGVSIRDFKLGSIESR